MNTLNFAAHVILGALFGAAAWTAVESHLTHRRKDQS